MMGILLPPKRFRRYSGIVVTWGQELSFCHPAALPPTSSPNSEAQMVFLGFSVGDLRGRRKWGPKGGVRMNCGSVKSYVLNYHICQMYILSQFLPSVLLMLFYKTYKCSIKQCFSLNQLMFIFYIYLFFKLKDNSFIMFTFK